jgi:serine/threonine protein phosphatase PrpC
MEDTYTCNDNFAGDVTCGMFGVFDGHGGITVSEYLRDRFPEELRDRIVNENPTDLVNIIEETFEKLDKEIKIIDSEQCGSTACIGIIRIESGHKVLYIANVGDTRALLSRNGVEERLSIDHRLSDKNEYNRVTKSGGIVLNDRVGGTLILTRAFGDYALKDAGVIVAPSIRKHFIRPFDRFVVIASDGVYDTLTDQEVIAM